MVVNKNKNVEVVRSEGKIKFIIKNRNRIIKRVRSEEQKKKPKIEEKRVQSVRNKKTKSKKSPKKEKKKKNKVLSHDEYDEIVNDVYNMFDENQKGIVEEALALNSGSLAVPMGTGKTIISLIISLKQCKYDGKILVVVGKKLMSTWLEQIEKFFGDKIDYEIIHDNYTKLTDGWTPKKRITIVSPYMLAKAYKKFDIGSKYTESLPSLKFGPPIKHYRRGKCPFTKNKKGLSAFYSTKWCNMIIDECDNYYNYEAISSIAVYAVCSERRWLLSGTTFSEPREKKLFGYYLLLNDESVPDNYPEFYRYIHSNEFSGVRRTLVLRTTNPSYIPPKVNNIIVKHKLSKNEELVYKSLKTVLLSVKNQTEEYKYKNVTQYRKYKSYLIVVLGYMRQILISPMIVIDDIVNRITDESTKHSDLDEIFINKLRKLNIDSWIKSDDSWYSSRIEKVIDLINRHKNEQVVIFSSYRKSLYNIMDFAEDLNRPLFTIEGSDSSTKRSKTINDFRKSKNGIMFLTYVMGSQGLNLQTASVVIIVDFWWNSSATSQAIARVLRRGQKADEIFVYYLTANTAIERAIFNMQFQKKNVAKIILDNKMPKNGISTLKIEHLISIVASEENADKLGKIYV